jgi:hypothetical protein
MAILQGSALVNCLYIPDFIPSGTVMIFESTSAPTSWVKSITHDNKSLRIVNGTITTTSASSSFSTVLSPSRTLTTPGTSAVQTGYQITAEPANVSITTVSPPTVSLTSNATAAGNHNHSYTNNGGGLRRTVAPVTVRAAGNTLIAASTAAGGGGQHPHTLSGNPHTHTISSPHSHTITESPHSHPAGFTAQSFAVYYRDVILASKD